MSYVPFILPLQSLTETVTGFVEQGLGKVARFVVEALLNLINPNAVKTLSGLIDKIKQAAQKPLNELLSALAKPLNRLVGGDAGSGGKKTPPVLEEDGHSLDWVEKDTKTGEYVIWGNASPSQRLGSVSKQADARLAAAVEAALNAENGPRQQLAAAMRGLSVEVKRAKKEVLRLRGKSPNVTYRKDVMLFERAAQIRKKLSQDSRLSANDRKKFQKSYCEDGAGNIAFADYNAGVLPSTIEAFSGETDVSGYAPFPTDPEIRKALGVSSQKQKIFDPAQHTEVQILAYLLRIFQSQDKAGSIKSL
jgi:hypothetical protein